MTRTLLLLTLLILSLLASGCVRSPPPAGEDRWVIPQDKYVFIDHHVSLNGEAANGSCGGGMMIDFPTYGFSRETKELSGMSVRELAVNGSLKVVYGDGMSLGGALGGGAATWLTPVYALPFEKDSVIIRSVAPDGLAIITAGNETIALPAGETRTNVTVTIDTRVFPPGTTPCTVKVTRTETFYNSGIIDKTLILRE